MAGETLNLEGMLAERRIGEVFRDLVQDPLKIHFLQAPEFESAVIATGDPNLIVDYMTQVHFSDEDEIVERFGPYSEVHRILVNRACERAILEQNEEYYEKLERYSGVSRQRAEFKFMKDFITKRYTGRAVGEAERPASFIVETAYDGIMNSNLRAEIMARMNVHELMAFYIGVSFAKTYGRFSNEQITETEDVHDLVTLFSGQGFQSLNRRTSPENCTKYSEQEEEFLNPYDRDEPLKERLADVSRESFEELKHSLIAPRVISITERQQNSRDAMARIREQSPAHYVKPGPSSYRNPNEVYVLEAHAKAIRDHMRNKTWSPANR